MSRNRAGTARSKERQIAKKGVLFGMQGGQAYASAPAVRGVALTKDQARAVRRDKMDERALEQRARRANRIWRSTSKYRPHAGGETSGEGGPAGGDPGVSGGGAEMTQRRENLLRAGMAVIALPLISGVLNLFFDGGFHVRDYDWGVTAGVAVVRLLDAAGLS